ncbi:hypothetical protein [Faecalicatena contorta]|nr:hypothetical protein [Faecalicatena contorta]
MKKRANADSLQMFGRIHIDTGKDEQQLITANPISRAVLLL